MKKEFKLSDKRIEDNKYTDGTYYPVSDFILTENVKEFIRRLKVVVRNQQLIQYEKRKHIVEEIDKLAGDL